MSRWILLLLTAVTLNAQSVVATDKMEDIGIITSMGGELRATRANGASRVLSVKSEIKEGDTLKTEKNSFARIKFVDGAEVSLLPQTELKVDAYSYKSATSPQNIDNILLNLTKGGVRSVTGLLGKRSPAAFKMNTPQGSVGVRGTDFGALLCNNDCADVLSASGNLPENGLHTDTASGTIVLSSAAGSIELPAGSFGFTPSLNTPPKLVAASQGIQVNIPSNLINNKAVENPEAKAEAVEKVAAANQMKKELFADDALNPKGNSGLKKALQQEQQKQQKQVSKQQQQKQQQKQQQQKQQQQKQQQQQAQIEKIEKEKNDKKVK